MQILIDEMTIVSAIVSASGSAVILVLVGVWNLLRAFKSDLENRLASVDKGLEDRQEAWRRMLEAYIKAEMIEFENLNKLRHEMTLIRSDLEVGYPTREEMDDRLTEMQRSIDMIHAVVERRSKAGEDPVSGRPVEGERRASG